MVFKLLFSSFTSWRNQCELTRCAKFFLLPQTEYGEDNLMQLIADDLGFGEDNLAMQPVMRQVLVAHLSRLVASGGGVPPSLMGSAIEMGNDDGKRTEDGEHDDDNSSLFTEDQDLSSFLSEISVVDGSESGKSDDPVIRIDHFMEALHLLRGQQRQPEPSSQRQVPSSEVLSVQKRRGHNNQQETIMTSIVHRIGGGYFCAQREILLPAGVQTRSDEPEWPINCEGSFDVDDLEVSFTPLAPSSSPALPTKGPKKVIFGRWHTVGYPRTRKPLALLLQDPNRRFPTKRNPKPNAARYGEEDGCGFGGFGGGFGRSNTAKGTSSNVAQGYVYRPTTQRQPAAVSPLTHPHSHYSGTDDDAYMPSDEAPSPPQRTAPAAPSVVVFDETAAPPLETPVELFQSSSMLGERFAVSTIPISVIREEDDEEDEEDDDSQEEGFVSATMALWKQKAKKTTQQQNSAELGLERHALLKQVFDLIDENGDGTISRTAFNYLGQLIIAASSDVALKEGAPEGTSSTAIHVDEATFDELCGASSEKVEESSPRLQHRLSFARFEAVFAASPETDILKRVVIMLKSKMG